jgi:toxin HigB-1
MIRQFRHKGLERFFTRDDTSGINPQFALKLRRMLTALNDSSGPQGMNIPNYRLHPMKGERKRALGGMDLRQLAISVRV